MTRLQKGRCDRVYRNTEGCIGEQMGVSECVKMYRSMGDVPELVSICPITEVQADLCTFSSIDVPRY